MNPPEIELLRDRPLVRRLAERLSFASALIEVAGELALGYFARVGTLTVQTKGAQDMATEADLAVEALIRERIETHFPNDGMLGEETGYRGPVDPEGVWVVDPIDGTQPFVSGIPTWCISIAFVQGEEVMFGLVNNPGSGELFIGAKWLPATLNGNLIHPRSVPSIADGLTYLGASTRVGPDKIVPVLDRLLRAGGMFVRGGSGALGLCDVACGRLVGYVEAHINSWDCLGAVAILEAAGCRVNRFLEGDALLEGNLIVAGPPAVYDELVAILGSPNPNLPSHSSTPAT